jgi:hypothetical protein
MTPFVSSLSFAAARFASVVPCFFIADLLELMELIGGASDFVPAGDGLTSTFWSFSLWESPEPEPVHKYLTRFTAAGLPSMR